MCKRSRFILYHNFSIIIIAFIAHVWLWQVDHKPHSTHIHYASTRGDVIKMEKGERERERNAENSFIRMPACMTPDACVLPYTNQFPFISCALFLFFAVIRLRIYLLNFECDAMEWQRNQMQCNRTSINRSIHGKTKTMYESCAFGWPLAWRTLYGAPFTLKCTVRCDCDLNIKWFSARTTR